MTNNARLTNAILHGEGFVQSFIKKKYRNQLAFDLQKRRGDFVNRFCDNALDYIAPRFVVKLPKKRETPMGILQELTRLKSWDVCYAISMNSDIDGQILPLADALSIVFGRGLTTILSCLPGQLAYIETEPEAGTTVRFIVSRI